MTMVIFQIKDKDGRVLKEIEAHESPRHMLMPGTAASIVNDLMADRLAEWAEITIKAG